MNNILHNICDMLLILIIVYFILGALIFFSLIFSPYDVKITRYSDNSVEITHGIKRVLICLFISLVWIFAIKDNNE